MITGKSYEVEKVNMKLSRLFFKWLDKLEKNERDKIVKKSNELGSFFKGRKVSFHNKDKIIKGIYGGINKEGGLILEQDNGAESIFFSGEICL